MNIRSITNNQNEDKTKEESSNSIENQTRNPSLNINNDDPIASYDDSILGVSFKMEITPDPDLTEEKVIIILYSKVEELTSHWIQYKDIEGIYTQDHKVIVDEFKAQALDWALENRVIFKKHIIIAETFIDLKTEKKVFQLYSSQKELCKKYCLKLEKKKSVEGFT